MQKYIIIDDTQYPEDWVEGSLYKNQEAFDKKEGVCYIPETSTQAYTYDDFLKLCKGVHEDAVHLFAVCEWAHPETYIDQWEDQERTLNSMFQQFGQSYE